MEQVCEGSVREEEDCGLIHGRCKGSQPACCDREPRYWSRESEWDKMGDLGTAKMKAEAF
jgi:hypothetical protein